MSDYKEGKFIKKYKKQMRKTLQTINPDWSDKKIDKVLDEMIDERLQNPTCVANNNYTGESRDTTLLSVIDWYLDNEPIIAGNFTFYRRQDQAINPVARMLKEKLADRKATKKLMFKAIENKDKYNDLDRTQNNIKKLVNSYYGASGAPTSAFYSQWSGPATTASCQESISTAEQLFEGFAADNYIFLNLTELLEWCNVALKDYDGIDDWIKAQSIPMVLDRLLDKIMNKEDNDEEILSSYLSTLSDEEVTFLYYKNNIFDFIEYHDEIKDIILDIFDKIPNLDYVDVKDPNWYHDIPKEYDSTFAGKSAKDWNSFVNKSYFMDPNDPPECIIDELEQLKYYVMKYVYIEYLSFDRIYRLKNFNRKVVTVIDTDSNILSLDTLINYIFDNIIKGETFGREYENNVFIAINTVAYLLTTAVGKILYEFSASSNICEDYRTLINMKNEFLFSRLCIGNTKKRYISEIKLREGNLLDPPKYDIKGFDFKKATTSEYSEEFFEKLIKKYILNGKDIDVTGLINDCYKFKETIRESIRNGDKTFLPNAAAKELEAYSNPSSIQSIRGSLAWNILFPNQMIEFPTKVSLVKLNIFTEDDIKDLKDTEPEIYNTIIDKIFNDTTGMFVEIKDAGAYVYIPEKTKNDDWTKKIPKKYRTKYKKLGPKAWNEFLDTLDLEDPKYSGRITEENSKGLQVLAIPSTGTIPKWLDPYIDYNTIINNILSAFAPVLKIFNVPLLEEGRSRKGVNRKTEGIGNIIKI